MNIGYLKACDPLPYLYVSENLQLEHQHTELTEQLTDHLSKESSQLAWKPHLEGPRIPYCLPRSFS